MHRIYKLPLVEWPFFTVSILSHPWTWAIFLSLSFSVSFLQYLEVFIAGVFWVGLFPGILFLGQLKESVWKHVSRVLFQYVYVWCTERSLLFMCQFCILLLCSTCLSAIGVSWWGRGHSACLESYRLQSGDIPFPVCIPFISFLCLIVPAKASSIDFRVEVRRVDTLVLAGCFEFFPI